MVLFHVLFIGQNAMQPSVRVTLKDDVIGTSAGIRTRVRRVGATALPSERYNLILF